MISSIILFAAVCQAPQSGPSMELTWEWMESTIVENQVVYRIQGLEARAPERFMRANICEIRMDKATYLAATSSPNSETQIQSVDSSQPAAYDQIDQRLISSLGIPTADGLILAMELSGDIKLSSPLTTMTCDQLIYDASTGITNISNADLQLPAGSGPKGWPLRLMCKTLRENRNGQMLAEEARLTTCDAESPHYSLRLSSLVGVPIGESRYRWKPAGAWLNLADWSLLPLPAPEIDESGVNENAFIGFKGIRLLSSNRLGQSLQVEFGSSGRSEAGTTFWNWTMAPSWSTKRGFPTSAEVNFSSEKLSSKWSFFALQDLANDSHPFSRRIQRWSDTRWSAGLDNTYQFNDDWRAELDLAFASDPLVGPEFSYRDWLHQDDSQSELYLNGQQNDSVFEASFSAISDRSGFVPLAGYSSGSTSPRFYETLPVLRYSALPRTIVKLPAGDEFDLPLNLSFGSEFGRMRLRDLAPNAADGTNNFVNAPVLTRDRLRMWADLNLPIKLGPFSFSAGTRWDGLGYNQDLLLNDNPGKSLLETNLNLGILFTRNFADGWRHRVLPQARWRNRSYDGTLPSNLPQFDAFDAMAGGSAVEFSLRQFFLPPETDQPWVDIDLMLPWYPNPNDRLVDPLFPTSRTNSTSGAWGPAELRLAWTPAAAGEILAPLRFDVRLRRDKQIGLEEVFSRLAIQTNDDFRWGVSLSKVDGLFSFAEAWSSWRMTDNIGFEMGMPWRFDELSARRSRFQLNWYAHDFVLELGLRQDTSVGDTGFFFNILPRFLIESPTR